VTTFNQLCGYFVGNQKKAMILMIAGVGVLRNGKYEFISHMGDYIGSAPISVIENMICVLRRKGIEPTKPYHGITYILANLAPTVQVNRWIHYYFEYPIEIELKPTHAKVRASDALVRAMSWVRVVVVYSWWPTLVAMSRLQWDWRKWRHINPCAEIKMGD
jgi:hypothetical protein